MTARTLQSEYCSAPWQVTIDVCCGLCPSPAINAYGTVAGLCIASFFAMLIVLFQPAQSAWYIAAQLALAHMYLVAIMARDMMGTASNGTNGIQRWHAEWVLPPLCVLYIRTRLGHFTDEGVIPSQVRLPARVEHYRDGHRLCAVGHAPHPRVSSSLFLCLLSRLLLPDPTNPRGRPL